MPTEALVRVIREFKPHVMTTYDENGGYPHPDHIAATRCRSPPTRPQPTTGSIPTRARRGRSRSCTTTTASCGKRMQLLQEEFAKHGQEGPFDKWLKHWDPETTCSRAG